MDYRKIIQKSLDYIERNLKTEITARELADLAGFSLYYFYRIFQSATGMPVMQYILRRRLLHAIYDIHRGAKRIDAALAYGFDTYSGFYKAFQREFCCTPSEYLKKHRAKRPYPINLFKEEHMNITHSKAAEILKRWNLEHLPVSDVYYDNNGTRNDSAYYAGEDHVLKFTANLGHVKTHIALSHALERAGLQTAIPVKTADGQEFVREGELYFYLTTRLRGQHFPIKELYQDASTGRFLGQIIGRLHLALQNVEGVVNDADLRETLFSWAVPKAKAALDLSETFCTDYLQSFDALYPLLPRQIIHRDPNPGNILHSGSTWGFLDFELSEQNARIYDPCYAAAAVLSESFGEGDHVLLSRWISIYKEILCGYNTVIPLTDAEWKAVPYILLANQFVCVAWFSEQEKYTEIYEINKRMTNWLAENFDPLRFS